MSRFRARTRRVSLRRSLPVSFAAVALLTMLVLGAILVPLLGRYYAQSERSYVTAGAQLAAQDLAQVDWAAVAAAVSTAGGPDSAAGTAAVVQDAKRRTQAVALSTQLRIQVLSPIGALLVDSGPVGDIDPTGIVQDLDEDGIEPDNASSDEGSPEHGLPNPFGEGLFGGGRSEEAGSRSHRVSETQLTGGGLPIVTVRASESPAYASTALRSTLIAWLIAGIAAVLLAAGVGWLTSRRLTRPLLAITAASDSMAKGDLAMRAKVERTDEIGSLAGSFNSMADKVQQTVSTLRRFVADAAHELGTPLTALEGDLELALGQESETERSRLIRRAMSQAERIDQLSSDLLRLSRLDAATSATEFEAMDLIPLVRQVADAVASRAEQSGVDLALELPIGEIRVRANAESLRTAIDNLVDNAVKFTPDGGAVTVGVKTDKSRATIWVEDTGIGIPPEDMEGLFGRFHRGRNASAYPGSGLGLAIVQATMTLHGGSARVDSSSAGSRFELILPLL